MTRDSTLPGGEPSTVHGRTLDVRALPPAIVRELVTVLGPRGSALLASRDRFVTRERLVLVLVPVGLLLALAFAASHFAAPCFPRQEASWSLLYAIPLTPLAVALVRAVNWVFRSRGMPFAPGVYVLARDVVIAHGPQLRIVPLASVAGIGAPRRMPLGGSAEITLWIEGEGAETCTLPATGAEAVVDSLEKAREAALAPDTGRRRYDALSELRGSSAWDRASTARPRSDVPLSIAVAVPIALALGVAAMFARNLASDALALAGAVARGSVEDLECYLEGGGSETDRVRADVLPRTAYRHATTAGDARSLGAYVEAYPDGPDTAGARERWIAMEYASARGSSWSLRAFVARFPDAAQSTEARAALPRLALDEAIQADEVDAYTYVIHEHAGTPEAEQARARRHARYEQALASILARGGRPEATDFLRALFEHLEANDGQEVLVRFRTPTNEALRQFDAAVEALEDMPIEPLAPQFSRRLSVQREALVFDRLNTAFRTVVTRDVLPLARGGQLPDPLTPEELEARLEGVLEEHRAAETARIEEAIEDDSGRPEIRIDYAIVPTGSVYVSTPGLAVPDFGGLGFDAPEPERRTFAGFRIVFAIEMRLPGRAERHAFTLDVAPPPTFSVDGGEDRPNERTIYEVMATGAFDRLGDQLSEAFFGTGQTEAPRDALVE